MKSLTKYLYNYSRIQRDILLVYHPTTESPWSDRCFYQTKYYQPHKKYNHRSVLDCEVVIEYDYNDLNTNKRLIEEIEKRYKKDGIEYALWYSGGKSYHLHALINIPVDWDDLQGIKRSWVFYYTAGLDRPDMQVLSKNSLIRAEYGVHEKTQKYKKPIRITKGFPFQNPVKKTIIDKHAEFKENFKPKPVDHMGLIEGEALKYILNPDEFRKHNDGRERGLFIVIHAYKQLYSYEYTVKLAQNWYKKVGGWKLSSEQVRDKVSYQWDKEYRLERFIKDLLYDVGVNKKLYKSDTPLSNK